MKVPIANIETMGGHFLEDGIYWRKRGPSKSDVFRGEYAGGLYDWRSWIVGMWECPASMSYLSTILRYWRFVDGEEPQLGQSINASGSPQLQSRHEGNLKKNAEKKTMCEGRTRAVIVT